MLKDVKVVGYYKGISKKNGKEYVNLSVTYKKQPGGNDVEIAGEFAETYFVPEQLMSKISPKDIGSTIKVYDMFVNKQNRLLDIMR